MANTGSVVVTEASDFISSPARFESYFGVAQSLLPGVHVLALHTPQCSMALALVTAHVLECLLKAFLARTQPDPRATAAADEEVKKAGHNLKWLWVNASQRGLEIPATPPDWALILHGLHDRPFKLRYSRDLHDQGLHGVVTPGAQPMVAELDALVGLVRDQLTK
jgi:hypothetical protein